MIKKIELTPEQLDYLLTMLTEHAEWIDPLSEEDRKLVGVLDNIAGQHPDMFAVVVRATVERREVAQRLNEQRQAAK